MDEFFERVLEEFEDLLHEYKEVVLSHTGDEDGLRITTNPDGGTFSEVLSDERHFRDRFEETLVMIYEELFDDED